ncbi:unnamed protein product [Onchocerca flexuosa]|nr:unnamed protein product [Onchocerca flexuosa]
MIKRKRLKSEGVQTVRSFSVPVQFVNNEEKQRFCRNDDLNSSKFSSQLSDVDDADNESDTSAMVKKHQKYTRRELERMHYQLINERVVNDVTLDFFYKPRTVTVLVIICVLLVIPAFSR